MMRRSCGDFLAAKRGFEQTIGFVSLPRPYVEQRKRAAHATPANLLKVREFNDSIYLKTDV